MDQDLRVFRQLILWIWDHHERPWAYSIPRAGEIYNTIQMAFQSLGGEEELQAALPSEEKVQVDFPGRKYLYLDPVTHGPIMVPALSMKSDFGRSVPELSLQVGLFLKHEDEVRALGYRFEAPEGQGMHHYYHAQLIHGFHDGSRFPHEEYYDWLPTRQPALPLDANNPVKLILSLLLSLYGLTYLGKLKTDPTLGNQLDGYLHDMLCCSFAPITWYWAVKPGKQAKRPEYHETQKRPDDFQADIRKKYNKCEISGTTQGAYKALRKREKGLH